MSIAKDYIVVTETVSEFRKRKGIVQANQSERISTFSMKNGPDHQKNNGHVFKVGNTEINKNATSEEISKILSSCSEHSTIFELYPTRFCVHCKRPSKYFVELYERGHATCTKCGTVNPMSQENISLHLNDSGTSNKYMWNITPGMSHRDCVTTRLGKRITTPGRRTPSHLRNYRRIRDKIDSIADEWHAPFIEKITTLAKNKLRRFYYTIHDEENNTGYVKDKMPHGGAAIAAACFYAAVLEYEQIILRQRCVCTLPAIQVSAQQVRDHKNGRKTRDVTDMIIIKYTKLLKRYGLCSAKIPQIGAKTLQYSPETSALEHSRMAIFQKCNPTHFHLPKNAPWGIKIGNTNQGVLYIESVNTDGEAFKAGIRKGDYICQFEKDNLPVDMTPTIFQERVVELKTKSSDCTVMQMTIMRKKKNIV